MTRPAISQPPEPPPPGSLDEIYRAGKRRKLRRLSPLERRFVQRCDGVRTVEEASEQSSISPTLGLIFASRLARRQVIKRLRQATGQGHAIRRSPEEPLAAFSLLEESFFSSEVQPIDECDEPFETLWDKLGQHIFRGRLQLEALLHRSRPPTQDETGSFLSKVESH